MGAMDGMGGMGGLMGGGGTMPPGGPIEAITGGGNTPYAHGYGMGAPGPFQGYMSGPGIQAPQGYGDPSQGGGDLTQRGIGENYFGTTAGAYVNPGMSERFAAGSLNRYGDQHPEGTTNQQENYGRFAATRPDVMAEPGLDKYYDRASERLGRDMNNQLAARGAYGSSVGVGQLGDAMTDLRADQAKHEADYNLRRLGEERGWEGLQGSLAGNADANSLNNSANDLSWLSGLNNIGQGADAFGLSRLGQGQGAANGAQGAEQNRWQSLLNNEMGMGNTMGGMMGDAYNGMLQTDQDLMNNSMGMGMGLASEALNQDYRNQQKQKDDAQWGMDMATGVGGMMGGL